MQTKNIKFYINTLKIFILVSFFIYFTTLAYGYTLSMSLTEISNVITIYSDEAKPLIEKIEEIEEKIENYGTSYDDLKTKVKVETKLFALNQNLISKLESIRNSVLYNNSTLVKSYILDGINFLIYGIAEEEDIVFANKIIKLGVDYINKAKDILQNNEDKSISTPFSQPYLVVENCYFVDKGQLTMTIINKGSQEIPYFLIYVYKDRYDNILKLTNPKILFDIKPNGGIKKVTFRSSGITMVKIRTTYSDLFLNIEP